MFIFWNYKSAKRWLQIINKAKGTYIYSKYNRYHQNGVSCIIRWKFMTKVPRDKHAKDDNWSNDQQQCDKQWPGIRPKYQSSTKNELLQRTNRKKGKYKITISREKDNHISITKLDINNYSGKVQDIFIHRNTVFLHCWSLLYHIINMQTKTLLTHSGTSKTIGYNALLLMGSFNHKTQTKSVIKPSRLTKVTDTLGSIINQMRPNKKWGESLLSRQLLQLPNCQTVKWPLTNTITRS